MLIPDLLEREISVAPSDRLRRGFRLVVATAVTVASGAVAALPAHAAPSALPRTVTTAAVTSATERRRVDRVKAPKLGWFKLSGSDVSLATTKLPRDYDKPNGAKVEVALAKLPATDQAHKVGTLFINPGGPGGSGVELTLSASLIFSPSVLKRFDIVGFDPRGGNYSSEVACFSNFRQLQAAESGMGNLPITAKLRATYLASAERMAKGCSGHGKSLAAAVSTAEVARDMDVLRRAVGDRKLNYFGFSYGSYLGEVYANMFPDRLRSMVIDGVIDPVAWQGTSATSGTPMSLRLKSAEGSWSALQETFRLCKLAGPTYCALSNPEATFEKVAKNLRTAPVDDLDLDYQSFISMVLSMLYSQEYGPEAIIDIVSELNDYYTSVSATGVEAATTAVSRLKKLIAAFGFPYDNSMDTYSSVVCTDALQPKNPSVWRPLIYAEGNTTAKYFAEMWGWQDVQCATKYWKATDEDAYRGSFTHYTSAPVLIVGDYHDPATNYAGAVATHKLMPNSYLLSSDSWGHTAYGTSACVTDAVNAYLRKLAKPADKVCSGDYVPFTTPEDNGGDSGNGKSDTELSVASMPLQVRANLPRLAATVRK